MLSELRLKDDDLKRWVDEISNYGIRRDHLDYDGVQTIFETHNVRAATSTILKADLRFQWHVEEAVAVRRLEGLIEFLAVEKEIDERLAELNSRLIADHKLESYDAVEAERRMLRARKAELIDTGYNLGLDEPEQDME